jgi:hypothetical protein
MKSNKIILILIINTLTVINLKAQSSYILRDSLMSLNLKLIEGTDSENANFIKVKMKKNEIAKYTPQDLKEYGLKDGRVYISKQINFKNSNQKVFLERLVRGRITIKIVENISILRKIVQFLFL